MTCQEIAVRYNVAEITVRKWAAANEVKYIGEGVRKTYQWTEDDCKRFEERREPGWEKGRPRKTLDHFSANCMKDGKFYVLMIVRDSKFVKEGIVTKVVHDKYRLVVCPDGGGQIDAEYQPEPNTFPDIEELAEKNGFEVIDFRAFIKK